MHFGTHGYCWDYTWIPVLAGPQNFTKQQQSQQVPFISTLQALHRVNLSQLGFFSFHSGEDADPERRNKQTEAWTHNRSEVEVELEPRAVV